ncbi:MAG TPA: Fic family protein [Candidatus Limnocylindrales bacterium]|nr:Fic family protein [Candidatus Limnocylindrales bacterium]
MLFTFAGLDPRETEVLERIEAYKEKLKWQLHEPKRWVGSLRRLSFARAIQGSNSIEGYDAKLDDAAAVALGEDPLDADTETTLALEGYRDAMTYVLQLANETDFEYSIQLIKSLHFMMTKYRLDNRPGLWRLGSVYVRKEETGQIVYEGPDIDEVPDLITELVAQIKEHAATPPIVRAGMAHLNLVMIHPFRDGNGRMARCLQSLILARSGVLSPVFMSIEEYLGRNTQSYYDILAEVGKGSWQPHNDTRPWVRYVLRAHLRQAMTLLRRVRESERTWIQLEDIVDKRSLPGRTIHALFDASINFRVRNSTYRGVLRQNGEEITEQTASRDLKQLVDLGLLVPDGERRGRHYVAGEPIRQIRRNVITSRDPRDDTDPFAD